MQALTACSANAPESSDAPWQEGATVLALFVIWNGGMSSAKAVVAATARASRPEAGKSDRVIPRRYTGKSG